MNTDKIVSDKEHEVGKTTLFNIMILLKTFLAPFSIDLFLLLHMLLDPNCGYFVCLITTRPF